MTLEKIHGQNKESNKKYVEFSKKNIDFLDGLVYGTLFGILANYLASLAFDLINQLDFKIKWFINWVIIYFAIYLCFHLFNTLKSYRRILKESLEGLKRSEKAENDLGLNQ